MAATFSQRPAGTRLVGMTISVGSARPDDPDRGGDVYLTDAGVEDWVSMLDTLDIAPERWIDRPVLSGMHIRYCLDGSGSADVRLQLAGPPQVIEVLHHQFPAGHMDRVGLDDPVDPS